MRSLRHRLQRLEKALVTPPGGIPRNARMFIVDGADPDRDTLAQIEATKSAGGEVFVVALIGPGAQLSPLLANLG